MPPAREDRPTRRWALAAAAAAALAYAPTIGHPFAFDDDIVVARNRLIRSAATLPALVSRTEWSGGGLEVRAWRPLTALTYAANHALSGLAPWSYHLANVLLHALAAALVVLLGRAFGLPDRAAGIAALLFAVHPVHVEAVANVVGRKDVLATILLLAMMLAQRAALERGGARLALPAAAYLGAMLSKEVGAVGIGLAALQDLAFPAGPAGAQGRRRRAILYASCAAALAAWLALYRAVAGGLGAPPDVPFVDNPAAHAAAAVRVATAVAVVGKGLLLQVLPVGQSPDWSFDAIPLVRSPLDPRLLASAAVLALWIAAGLRLRRRAPVVLLSAGWYLGALLPASNLLFPVGTIFGERLLYLPGVGLALLAGAGADAGLRRLPRRAALASGAALAVILAALAGAAVRYSRAWGDEADLFRLAAERVPRSAKVHVKLAEILLRGGRAAEALPEIERALAIHAGDPHAETVRADVLRALGRGPEAEAALGRALALDPGHAGALYGLGRLARDAGRLEEAAGLWERALAADPRQAAALADLATWRMLRGEAAAALALSLRAVEANERQASAWYNLALLQRARGDRAAAREAAARFVETAGPEYAAEAQAVRAALARGEP
ncbi:MAG TPA: tetratricopeptide repeat protein [Anaeromyxobacteraceae bacterium]|nr:tetratricopeptide repeat protein [Anaeromyxobacteraceae bacterium]